MRRPLRTAFAFVSLAVVASIASACGSTKPTSITLKVRTDLSCDDLRTVSIAVGDPATIDTRPAQLVTTACEVLDREMSTVGSLVVVPSSANDAEIGVRVLGGVTRMADRCSADAGFKGCIVARRLLRFLPEREIEVVVDLRIDCTDIACTTSSTCVRGKCTAAVVDPNACGESTTGCGEDVVGVPPPGTTTTPAGDGGTGPVPLLPDGATAPGADGGPVVAGCAADEKSCGGLCVKVTDPIYGCTTGGCASCAGADTTVFTCTAQGCAISACKPGFKSCGGTCVPTDAAHGCDAAACAACDATNGVASCSGGSCALACSNGFKRCGGKCVSVSDPSYGCSTTGCSASACPAVPSGSTVVCNGTTCEVGTCSAGTKKCGQNCVPVDANNGCQEAGRCTPCASNQVCVGSPSTCQCVAESPATTCAGKACGSATNNCGQTIACTDTCANLGAGYACNVGGAGPNSCGCVPDNTAACAGKQCGPAVNNCGQAVQCPDTCSTLGTQYACGANGAGPNQCGCTPLTKFQACGYQECGSVPNGCGANVNCGNCPGGQYCRCEFQCMSGTICP